MTGYILNDNKTFEIFVRTEKILNKGVFPAMKKFQDEEIEFWKKIAREYAETGYKIIEIGFGGGRILKALTRNGVSCAGFDNDPLFVKYCKKQKLDVFRGDATSKVPKRHRAKYQIVGISFNTLYNFPKKTRKKWMAHAAGLLKKNGLVILNVYSDTHFSRKTIGERVRFYKATLSPPSDYTVQFFDNGKERGIKLCDPAGRERFFSRWTAKKELTKEIGRWKKFGILQIQAMKCGIGWNVLLAKK